MPDPIDLPELREGDLRLRAPADRDVHRITAMCQDAEVQRWTRVPSPYTEDNARAFVAFAAEGLATGRGVHLVAVRGDDVVLGSVGIGVDHRDFSGGAYYRIAPDARRQRIAVCGCRLLLRFAFEQLDLAYISLHAAAANEGSNAVARRLGFTLEGTSRDAMLLGPMGDRTAPRGDANLWGLRPGELT